jgi:Spy/CpxP family protein refolding chaperone
MRTRTLGLVALAVVAVLLPVGLAAASGVPSARAAVLDEQPRYFLAQDIGGMGGSPMDLFMSQFGEQERTRLEDMMQRGRQLQYLEDPDVRADLQFSTNQDEKFQAVREKAMNMGGAIAEEMRAKFEGRFSPDMTPEERQAALNEIIAEAAKTVRAVTNDLEGMLNEANKVLTPEQRTKLAAIIGEKTDYDIAVGYLASLLLPRARTECDLSTDQQDSIRMILKDLAAEYRSLRTRTFGADKVLTAEDKKGEKYQEFNTRHQELMAKTRSRIMSLFLADQREKIEKYLAFNQARWRSVGGRFGPFGGMGRRPGAAPGTTPPAPPATPATPAPAAK